MSGTVVRGGSQPFFVDLSSVVNQQQAGNQLLAAIVQQLKAGVAITAPPSYTVATLPTTAGAGTTVWASNGRKPAEGSGSGTGVPVFWNPSTSQWFSFLSGSVVAS